MFGPAFSASAALGVPSRCKADISSSSVGPWPPAFRLSGCCGPPLFPRLDVGVFSKNEQSFSFVRGSGVARANNTPRHVVPEVGKVCEDNVEAPSEVDGDVLQDDDSRS